MSRPVRAQKAPSQEYLRLWKIIDGAVRDAFANHPEYLWLSVFRGWNNLRTAPHADQPQRLKGLRRSNANPQCRKTFG